jgi:beta-galactosidase
MKSRLEINSSGVTLNGQPFRIISGSMHYFRIVPDYWEDRLRKLKAFGCNCVETYCIWNLHEKQEGAYDFTGMLNLRHYLELAHELGLHVLLRPGPFICSEWDNGGLPWWLLRYPDIRLRCMDETYIRHVTRYMRRVCAEFIPYLSTNGGPILAVQVENEYGAIANGKDYLLYLKNLMTECGVDVPFFTSDGASDFMQQHGSLPGVWQSVNFRLEADKNLALLARHQPDLPLFVGEYWNGRAGKWGQPYAPREIGPVVDNLETILAAGSHINFYMFHGGTTFGLMNGARYEPAYVAELTSYDVDAPLNEYGEPTAKYYAEQAVIYRHLGQPIPPPPPASSVRIRALGPVRLDQCAPILTDPDAIAPAMNYCYTPTMEAIGQGYGWILYSTMISGADQSMRLRLERVHDRATVYVDGCYAGTVERDGEESSGITVAPAPTGTRLDILVESRGRINAGWQQGDRKGITDRVLLNGFTIQGWDARTIAGNDLPTSLADRAWTSLALPTDHDTATTEFAAPAGLPAFYRGTISLSTAEIADTFLTLPGWNRGAVWLNGFCLGRYWQVGPQQTLYVPAPLLREGPNELVIFEVHDPAPDRRVEFIDRQILGDLRVSTC